MTQPSAERVALARQRLESARCALADLDGTLIFGSEAAPGAAELLARFGERLAVVSNYSTVTAEEMSVRLAAMQLPISPERIILAGEMAVRELARCRPGARVLCVMTVSMRRLAAELGLQLVDDEPEILLVGRDLEFSYQRLSVAMRAVHHGAEVFASNLDRSHPGSHAQPVPETGSLLSAILAAAPATPVEVIGKPHARMYLAALDILGVPPAESVMLGDNPDTDIKGAHAAGIPSILIGSGAEADTATLREIVHW